MSRMEERIAEGQKMKMQQELSQKTEDALASIEYSERRSEAGGYAVIAGAMSYGDASLGDGLFAKASSAAKWFCIWMAMIIPVYLFWAVVF
ncbi:hypothetical protein [Litoreibacter roseus]|uniref:Uncharacterized protein n=1 Tax=Litoreibacter roseus TaxID=2601869 RepID=A0A6N6JA66_9RHOB|nr:hypothetical protein [Litoreibacter roseus]GFE62996.1 hypothetical protein KIN_00700 [Litoreibacter roseus]